MTFFPEFHADLSRYKEMRVYCTHYKKTPTLFTAILRRFGPRRQNFNTSFQFGLHTPVKFYPDPLTFAAVIREKPILANAYYAVMHLHVSVQLGTSLQVELSFFCNLQSYN